MNRVLLVAAGGALGSALRYLVATAALAWLGPAFPWGTLAVNLAGSFLIGLAQALAAANIGLGENARLFFAAGLLGGFTTYSAFSFETVALMNRGAWTSAWFNVVLTTSGCLVLCYAGIVVGRVLMAKF